MLSRTDGRSHCLPDLKDMASNPSFCADTLMEACSAGVMVGKDTGVHLRGVVIQDCDMYGLIVADQTSR
jgi:hypothetical protein